MFMCVVFLWSVDKHIVRHETESMHELHSDSTRTTQWFTIYRSTSPCRKFKNNTVIQHTYPHHPAEIRPYHPARSSRTTQWFTIHRSTSPSRKFKNYTMIQHTQIYITLPEIQEIMIMYWKLFKTKTENSDWTLTIRKDFHRHSL